MKADLDSITMRTFIRLIEGEDVEFEDATAQEARVRLQAEYMSIVGGRKMAYEVQTRNQDCNHQLALEVLEAARMLNGLGYTASAVEVYCSLGYTAPAEPTGEAMGERIEDAIGMVRLKIARAQQKRGAAAPAETGEKAGNVFLGERAAMMSYYKMHIDVNTLTAAEYAHLLKMMCDEIERQTASVRRKK